MEADRSGAAVLRMNVESSAKEGGGVGGTSRRSAALLCAS